MTQDDTIMPGFNRPTAIAAIGANDLPFSFAANADECLALAARLDVPSVDRLEASGFLRKESKNRIRLRGQFVADICQTSVLTLEEMSSRLQEKFSVLLCPEGDPLLVETDGEDKVMDSQNFDDIDVLDNEFIDLADQVAQFVSLAVDPYPREAEDLLITDLPNVTDLAIKTKGAVTFDVPNDRLMGGVDNQGKQNPFVVLKNLRQ